MYEHLTPVHRFYSHLNLHLMATHVNALCFVVAKIWKSSVTLY